MRALLAIAVLALIGCGNGRGPGTSCARVNTDPRVGNCDEGLVCVITDGCNGVCAGMCRLPCSTDAQCPKSCLCSTHISQENGDGLTCSGGGC